MLQDQQQQKPSIRERIGVLWQAVKKPSVKTQARAAITTGVGLVLCGVGWAAYQRIKHGEGVWIYEVSK